MGRKGNLNFIIRRGSGWRGEEFIDEVGQIRIEILRGRGRRDSKILNRSVARCSDESVLSQRCLAHASFRFREIANHLGCYNNCVRTVLPDGKYSAFISGLLAPALDQAQCCQLWHVTVCSLAHQINPRRLQWVSALRTGAIRKPAACGGESS